MDDDIIDKIDELPNRRYAVIVDEAHSSQSGEAADALRGVLAERSLPYKANGGEEPDQQDQIVHSMEGRQATQRNMSFFAFTATPKPRTLQVFGTPGLDGKPRAFHLYSMRQAIEERFILDVLQSYTTYAVYFKLTKAISEDPNLNKVETARAIARFVRLHPHNVAQKVAVIIEHFRNVVMNRIGGQAKAMIVTSGRLDAVHYKQEMDRYLNENEYTTIVERARAQPEDERDAFHKLLTAFLRRYSFLAQVMPFSDIELEKLYAYGRLLVTKLRADDSSARFQIQDEVALEYYRLQKISEGAIVLDPNSQAALLIPGDSSVHTNTIEEALLSTIIDMLNERFGTAFTPTDQLFIDQIESILANDVALAQYAKSNNIDNFKFPFSDQFINAVIERMDQNQVIADRIMNEDRFREVVYEELLRKVYARLRAS